MYLKSNQRSARTIWKLNTVNGMFLTEIWLDDSKYKKLDALWKCVINIYYQIYWFLIHSTQKRQYTLFTKEYHTYIPDLIHTWIILFESREDRQLLNFWSTSTAAAFPRNSELYLVATIFVSSFQNLKSISICHFLNTSLWDSSKQAT